MEISAVQSILKESEVHHGNAQFSIISVQRQARQIE